MINIIRFGNSVDCCSVVIQHYTFNLIERGRSTQFAFKTVLHPTRCESLAQHTLGDAIHRSARKEEMK